MRRHPHQSSIKGNFNLIGNNSSINGMYYTILATCILGDHLRKYDKIDVILK